MFESKDNLLLIDKPSEMTSFGVVARIRRILSKQYGVKVKVGHSGTLDPFATGLLIILTGSQTKNAMSLTKLDKEYEATIELGKSSSTEDPEGDITEVSSIVPKIEEIENVLSLFTGEIIQTPPIFSAIKIGGERAYKLARKGKKVEVPERKITIYDINIVSYSYPELKIVVRVSSGTYIRSLARDIGNNLKTGAYLKELRRTKVGNFSIDDAESLGDYGVHD